MGSSQSIEEVQDHVENLKYKVQTFSGTVTSKSYHKLQTEIIRTNTSILKFKKSRKNIKVAQQCDQMWQDLSDCLQILRTKVADNNVPDQINIEKKEENILITRRPKQDAATVIEYLEEETKTIEDEIEKMIQTKDYRKQALLEGKLKIFFTDVAIAKTEKGSILDVRKNKILQRLVVCYKHVKNEYDSDFDADFDSEFDNSSRKSDSTRTSTASNIYEEIPYFYEMPKPTQHSVYKEEKLPGKTQTKPFGKISYDTQANFDDLLNIDEYDYEEIRKYGNRTSILNTKEVDLNLDELLQDISYDNDKMDDFLKDVLEVTNKPVKSRDQESPKLDDHHQRHYEHVEKQSEVINYLNDELMKIKDKIESFSGKYKDQQYIEIENDLEKCWQEMNNIDDLGDSSLITGKEEHIDYIDKLSKYFEGIAKPAENPDEDYTGEEEPYRHETEIRKEPKPPILKIPKSKSSEFRRRRSYSNDSDTSNEDLDFSKLTTHSAVEKEISNSNSHGSKNLEPQRKIYPPIVKLKKPHKEPTMSDDEENHSINLSPSSGNEDDFKLKRKKIYPPIVKPTRNETFLNSETNTIDDNISKEENISDEEGSNEDHLWSNKQDFGDEEQVECNSDQEDDNEENLSDALNLGLLKRMVSTEDPQVPHYKTFEFYNYIKNDGIINEELSTNKEINYNRSQEDAEKEEDNNTTTARFTTLMKTPSETEDAHQATMGGNYNKYRSKQHYRRKNKGNKKRSVSVLIDYTDKIEEVLEDIEELKALNENFKQTQNYKIYAELQEKLMTVIRVMFDMDRTNFDKKSSVLYEIVSQDIQNFVNEM